MDVLQSIVMNTVSRKALLFRPNFFGSPHSENRDHLSFK